MHISLSFTVQLSCYVERGFAPVSRYTYLSFFYCTMSLLWLVGFYTCFPLYILVFILLCNELDMVSGILHLFPVMHISLYFTVQLSCYVERDFTPVSRYAY